MIVTTKVPDITVDNLDESKVILADNIVENVYPLFKDIYTEKRKEVTDLKDALSIQNKKINSSKVRIEELSKEYKKIKKVSKGLARISKLIESGLIYDSSLKHETVILLKIIDKLSEEKLDQQITKLVQFLNKRFSN